MTLKEWNKILAWNKNYQSEHPNVRLIPFNTLNKNGVEWSARYYKYKIMLRVLDADGFCFATCDIEDFDSLESYAYMVDKAYNEMIGG